MRKKKTSMPDGAGVRECVTECSTGLTLLMYLCITSCTLLDVQLALARGVIWALGFIHSFPDASSTPLPSERDDWVSMAAGTRFAV